MFVLSTNGAALYGIAGPDFFRQTPSIPPKVEVDVKPPAPCTKTHKHADAESPSGPMIIDKRTVVEYVIISSREDVNATLKEPDCLSSDGHAFDDRGYMFILQKSPGTP